MSCIWKLRGFNFHNKLGEPWQFDHNIKTRVIEVFSTKHCKWQTNASLHCQMETLLTACHLSPPYRAHVHMTVHTTAHTHTHTHTMQYVCWQAQAHTTYHCPHLPQHRYNHYSGTLKEVDRTSTRIQCIPQLVSTKCPKKFNYVCHHSYMDRILHHSQLTDDLYHVSLLHWRRDHS